MSYDSYGGGYDDFLANHCYIYGSMMMQWDQQQRWHQWAVHGHDEMFSSSAASSSAVATQRAEAVATGHGFIYILMGNTIYFQRLSDMSLTSRWLQFFPEVPAGCIQNNARGLGIDASLGNCMLNSPEDTFVCHEDDEEYNHEQGDEEYKECNITTLSSTQIKLLRDASHGAKQLDPSQHSQAIDDWEHLMQWCAVDKLWHTHSDVSSVFGRPPHRGQSVSALVDRLVNKTVTIDEIPPLVAVQHLSLIHI